MPLLNYQNIKSWQWHFIFRQINQLMTSNCYIDNMSLYTQISLYCTAYTAIYATARTLAYTSKAPNSPLFTGWSKKLTPFVLYGFFYALISSNIDRYSYLFLNQEKICNNTVAEDPTTPQVCRYTTLWNVSVLKATTEKTSSLTTSDAKYLSSKVLKYVLKYFLGTYLLVLKYFRKLVLSTYT